MACLPWRPHTRGNDGWGYALSAHMAVTIRPDIGARLGIKARIRGATAACGGDVRVDCCPDGVGLPRSMTAQRRIRRGGRVVHQHRFRSPRRGNRRRWQGHGCRAVVRRTGRQTRCHPHQHCHCHSHCHTRHHAPFHIHTMPCHCFFLHCYRSSRPCSLWAARSTRAATSPSAKVMMTCAPAFTSAASVSGWPARSCTST